MNSGSFTSASSTFDWSQCGCQNCSSSGFLSASAFWIAVIERGLGPGDHELQRQGEVGDDLLVVADVARVTHQELALVAGLGGLEQLGELRDP